MTDRQTTNNHLLPAAIIAAALVLAAALFYVGYQFQGSGAKTWDEERLTALIDQRLDARSPATLSDEEFAERVEQGIGAFIEKQRRAQARDARTQVGDLPPVDKESDHIRGNPQARITLVEYSDLECPFCKRFHGTAQQLVETYDGKLNWVYRHFPLDFHNPGAQKQAEASECAAELGGNEAFWRYADAIFERTESGGSGFPLQGLVPLAGELDLDEAKFQECLDSGRHTAKVEEQLRGGQAAGITGTPGNFLIDHATGRVIPIAGARPFEDFKRAVDELLAQPAQ